MLVVQLISQAIVNFYNRQRNKATAIY